MEGKRALILLAVLAVGLGRFARAEAAGCTSISACGTISTPGCNVLSANLTASTNSDCLVIDTSHVTLDLAGFEIAGSGTGNGITDNSVSHTDIAIRNGTVHGFGGDGIHLAGSSNLMVEAVRAIGNSGWGIYLNLHALVKDCLAVSNGNGIFANDGSLVSGNTALRNGFQGIVTGSETTITGNTVAGNGEGIYASKRNTISNNTVSGNVQFGITVECPSNLIGNTSRDNAHDAANLDAIYPGCTIKGNHNLF